MTLNNFNSLTEYDSFPTQVLSTFQEGSPKVGDPGFVVLTHDGHASWYPNIQDARNAAGTTEAIYAAFECNDFYRQFAEEAHLNKDGSETLSGPVLED